MKNLIATLVLLLGAFLPAQSAPFSLIDVANISPYGIDPDELRKAWHCEKCSPNASLVGLGGPVTWATWSLTTVASNKGTCELITSLPDDEGNVNRTCIAQTNCGGLYTATFTPSSGVTLKIWDATDPLNIHAVPNPVSTTVAKACFTPQVTVRQFMVGKCVNGVQVGYTLVDLKFGCGICELKP